MSDEFKRKLDLYEKGMLEGEELTEFEEELAKLEVYQTYLNEEEDIRAESQIDDAQQRKILRKSKWKARIQTGFIAFVLFIIVMIATSILTAVYYSWGNPDRSDVLADIIDYTLTVTDPYGDSGRTSVNAKTFFRAEMTRDLNKQIGMDRLKVGELKVDFLFSLMAYPERTITGRVAQNKPSFTFPGSKYEGTDDSKTLEHLPEGTIVSAYVSFNELIETKEVYNLLREKDLNLIWLAVDTGQEGTDDWDNGIVLDPIGLPAYPIWHDDDMKLDYREEEKGFLFGKTVSEGYSSPGYEEGDTDVLHTQFLKTLYFLKEHESKAVKLYEGIHLKLDERLAYLEGESIKHYGVVVTGPTKEVLKLRNEKLVHSLSVDEVSFWNWTN